MTAEHGPDVLDNPQRDQTDESLRAERHEADVGSADRHEAADVEADEIVRIARERADEVLDAARHIADRATKPPPTQAASHAKRAKADALLDQERSKEDAAVELERTERRRYLADFLSAEREVTDEHLTLERAHADTVIDARDEFLASVSHDLRSLLGSMALNAGLLVSQAPEGELGAKMRKHAATSQRLVGRMNRLVNDLLDVAGIEAGKLTIVSEEAEVDKIIHDTLEAFDPIAGARQITLDADPAPTSLHIRLDSGRILQVLANLVSNAIKFTPSGGHISIRVQAQGDDVQFAVTDTGIGIPDEALGGVFERFRQVRKDSRGLGLGLHISKYIVEAHGGRIWVESKLGVGSTFYFALPSARRSTLPPGQA